MMLSCKQMAEKLAAAAMRCENRLVIPTEELMTELQAMSKSFIGHYQDGWAPLAESTLNGWDGHPGKIALGYAPPDNPLLRTGEMMSSITFEVEMPRFGLVEGVLGSDSKVALDQEVGTVKIPPRPFLALAMSRSYAPAERIYGQFALALLEF